MFIDFRSSNVFNPDCFRIRRILKLDFVPSRNSRVASCLFLNFQSVVLRVCDSRLFDLQSLALQSPNRALPINKTFMSSLAWMIHFATTPSFRTKFSNFTRHGFRLGFRDYRVHQIAQIFYLPRYNFMATFRLFAQNLGLLDLKVFKL